MIRQAGLKRGMSCLDVGCGGGSVTLDLARLVGPNGRVVGMDFDAVKLDLAKQHAADKHVDNVFFVEADVTELEDINTYDFVYARFLLSNLKEPDVMLAKMAAALKAKGVLVIEDVDYRGHFSYPQNDAFDRYVELYQQLGSKHGTNPNIGCEIPLMMADAGLIDVEMLLADLVFDKGDGKTTSKITLDSIAKAVIKDGLATKAEMTRLGEELDKFVKSKRTLMSMPRIFQVWGTKVKVK